MMGKHAGGRHSIARRMLWTAVLVVMGGTAVLAKSGRWNETRLMKNGGRDGQPCLTLVVPVGTVVTRHNGSGIREAVAA